MIKVENVNLTLQKNDILKSVSVHFKSGMIHGLIGRNGSGKTMLMKCICGFVKPTSGIITVGGMKIGKDCDFPEKRASLLKRPDLFLIIQDLRILNFWRICGKK